MNVYIAEVISPDGSVHTLRYLQTEEEMAEMKRVELAPECAEQTLGLRIVDELKRWRTSRLVAAVNSPFGWLN